MVEPSGLWKDQVAIEISFKSDLPQTVFKLKESTASDFASLDPIIGVKVEISNTVQIFGGGVLEMMIEPLTCGIMVFVIADVTKSFVPGWSQIFFVGLINFILDLKRVELVPFLFPQHLAELKLVPPAPIPPERWCQGHIRMIADAPKPRLLVLKSLVEVETQFGEKQSRFPFGFNGNNDVGSVEDDNSFDFYVGVPNASVLFRCDVNFATKNAPRFRAVLASRIFCIFRNEGVGIDFFDGVTGNGIITCAQAGLFEGEIFVFEIPAEFRAVHGHVRFYITGITLNLNIPR